MQSATPLEPFVYKGIEVLVKREDANATGSHKDRGIWPLLDFYRKKKITKFVISSSGNAGISVAHYCAEHAMALDIFFGESVPQRKLGRLRQYASKDITLHESETPRKEAFQFSKKNGAHLISTSTDDHCLPGYSQIAKEIPKETEAIFVPASSGALAVGLFQGYKKSVKPHFFIAQTPRVHSLIAFDIQEAEVTSKSSMADAISDILGARKDQIHEVIQRTGGAGVVVEDRFINNAMKILVKQLRITSPSPNGALAFAAFLKVFTHGGFSYKKVVCFYTGE